MAEAGEPELGLLQRGQRVAERFEVLEKLGVGGLAEVYLVRHVQLGSLHALKCMLWRRRGLGERLLLEGRIQAQLRHPHVVSVTDVLHVDGQVALLMEYVDGNTLEALLNTTGAMPLDEALALFAPILSGVRAAHDAGVLHRDLKPSNVLLARASGGRWVPKVTDFGIAKLVAEEVAGNSPTRTGTALGTPGYMAPEQVEGTGELDARADVFSLAAILYEMLAGKKAFGEMPALTSTLTTPPPPLHEVVPGIPVEVSEALSAALARQPSDRLPDARSLVERLYPSEHPLRSEDDEADSTVLSLATLQVPPRPASPTLLPAAGGQAAATVMLPDAPPAPPPARRAGGLLLTVLVGTLLGGVVLASLAVGAWIALEPTSAPTAPPAVTVAPAAAPPVPVPEVPASAPETDVAAAPRPDGVEVTTPPVPASPAAPAAEPAEPEPAQAATPEDDPTADDPLPAPAVVDDDAVAEAQQPEPEPEPEPEPAPEGPLASTLLGSWRGVANGRAIELRIDEASGTSVRATVAFVAGTVERTSELSGSWDPARRRLELSGETESLTFRGLLTDDTLSGTYSRGRRALPWTATRR